MRLIGIRYKDKKGWKKDLPKLKGANLHEKFDKLIEVIKESPFQNPPPYEKFVGVVTFTRENYNKEGLKRAEGNLGKNDFLQWKASLFPGPYGNLTQDYL